MKILSLLALAIVASTSNVSALTIQAAHESAKAELVAQRGSTGFRWASDGPQLTDDKVAHFGIGFAAATVSAWAWDARGDTQQWGVWLWQGALWSAWEIKDGLVPWERHGAIGGDGFSWWDLAYSMAGASLALLIY